MSSNEVRVDPLLPKEDRLERFFFETTEFVLNVRGSSCSWSRGPRGESDAFKVARNWRDIFSQRGSTYPKGIDLWLVLCTRYLSCRQQFGGRRQCLCLRPCPPPPRVGLAARPAVRVVGATGGAVGADRGSEAPPGAGPKARSDRGWGLINRARYFVRSVEISS